MPLATAAAVADAVILAAEAATRSPDAVADADAQSEVLRSHDMPGTKRPPRINTADKIIRQMRIVWCLVTGCADRRPRSITAGTPRRCSAHWGTPRTTQVKV
ncbi:hypothetical protein E2C01_050612 [Portunus trituberculatus]|uniref:Uncharacterized protein n=1 Tax=Portunus trituberculatus TaxID=210409 RepID=A0A5B7GHH2_PORTR|nr:hypothetical protein [Portunus trituberculatus]